MLTALWVLCTNSQGWTLNHHYYLTVHIHLHDAFHHTQQIKQLSSAWKIHLSNAPSHSIQPVQQFLANTTFHWHVNPQTPQTWPHVTFPSSPDFRTLWNIMVSRCQNDKLQAMQQLSAIPKTGYDSCFQEWYSCWNKCIQKEKAYFKEG